MLQEKFNLTNHCSIITGAAQGLWESMARGLAEAGFNIVIADINIQKAKQAASVVEKVMIGQKRGSIINISSMSGIVVNTPQSQSSYNASKTSSFVTGGVFSIDGGYTIR